MTSITPAPADHSRRDHEPPTTSEATVVLTGEGRLYNVLGTFAALKLTGRETNGAFTVWENTVPPGGGPPPHVHGREYEDFFILEGEIEVFRLGQPPLRAPLGSYVHTPIGVPHTFKNTGSRPARLLMIAVPSGIEDFFAEVGQLVESVDEHLLNTPVPAGPPPPEVVRHLIEAAKRHGTTILPPPPATPR